MACSALFAYSIPSDSIRFPCSMLSHTCTQTVGRESGGEWAWGAREMCRCEQEPGLNDICWLFGCWLPATSNSRTKHRQCDECGCITFRHVFISSHDRHLSFWNSSIWWNRWSILFLTQIFSVMALHFRECPILMPLRYITPEPNEFVYVRDLLLLPHHSDLYLLIREWQKRVYTWKFLICIFFLSFSRFRVVSSLLLSLAWRLTTEEMRKEIYLCWLLLNTK